MSTGGSNAVLTTKNVEAVFKDCLFRDNDSSVEPVRTEGVTFNARFHPERLQAHRQTIHNMLAELPEKFKQSNGVGGDSFLNTYKDKDGNNWASLHLTQGMLVQLGLAIGEIEYPMPRDVWPVLPGGLPYIMVKQ